MALTQLSGTNSLLGENQENAVADGKVLDGKPIVGKYFAKKTKSRAALGNISNRTDAIPVASKRNAKSCVRQIVTRSKSAAVQKSAKSETKKVTVCTNPENFIQRVQELSLAPCPASPSPMDISANTSDMSVTEDDSLHGALPPNVRDIDAEDYDDPTLVSLYINEIYAYMRQLEKETPIKPRYLDGREISGRMRGILVDWLVQVHSKFQLLPETLYITVASIDRFLQAEPVSRTKLQLVGVTALLLACKYEEMLAPEISDFVFMTCNAYTDSEIRKMERIMLKTLNFSLGRPIPLHFLRRDSKAGEADYTQHAFAKYLMELTLVDYECVHLLPSQVAAAALCLSRKVLTSEPWDATMEHYTCYREEELVALMRKMAHLLTRAGSGKTTAIKTKYTSPTMMNVSVHPKVHCKVIQDFAAGYEH